MAWTEQVPIDADELCSLLLSLGPRRKFIARGQSQCWPTLMSSFDRLKRESTESTVNPIDDEYISVRIFMEEASGHLTLHEMISVHSAMDALLLMQHYGAPTRILDWTQSPWVAAYFACNNHLGDDGCIWIVDVELLDKRSREMFPYQHPLMHVRYGGLDAWRQVAHGTNDDLFVFFAQVKNPRMIAQASLFTASTSLGVDHAKVIDSLLISNPGAATRVTVRTRIKPVMLQRLAQMNVGSASLFPGIDGVCRYIHEVLKWRLPRLTMAD